MVCNLYISNRVLKSIGNHSLSKKGGNSTIKELESNSTNENA